MFSMSDWKYNMQLIVAVDGLFDLISMTMKIFFAVEY